MKILLEKVRAIDPAAAGYIEKNVIPRYNATGKEPPADLSTLFSWEFSPQGNEYWRQIYLQIVRPND